MVRGVFLRLLILLLFLFPLTASDGFAQTELPRGEFNVGFSYLSDVGQNFRGHGFNVGYAENATSWFQLEVQLDANFNLGTTDFDIYTTAAGPKATFKIWKLSPYGHFLLGASHFRAFGRTGTEFAIKYGGGVDYYFTPSLAARFELNDLVIWNPVSHKLLLNTGIVVRF